VELVINEDMDEKIVLYKELKSNINTLEKSANNILSDLTQMYLDGNRPKSPVLSMRITKVSSKKFDTTAFSEAHPDLYKQFVKDSEYSRTTIK
jgi:predicted phage-related endonuclease